MVKEALNALFLNKSDVLRDLLLVLLTTLISQKPQYKANILFWSFPGKSRQGKIHFKGHVQVHFSFVAFNTSWESSKIREKGNDPEKWPFCVVHSGPHHWSLPEFFFLSFGLFKANRPLSCRYSVFIVYWLKSVQFSMQQQKYSHTHISNNELVFLFAASWDEKKSASLEPLKYSRI